MEQYDSLPVIIEKLCGIEVKKCRYSRPNAVIPMIKKAALNTLFYHSERTVDFPSDLLQLSNWTVDEVTSAVAYRMRVDHRSFYAADKLEDLSHQLTSESEEILKLLLHLARLSCPQKLELFQIPTSNDITRIIQRKQPIVSGDYPFKVFNPMYTLPNLKEPSEVNQPVMYPQLNDTEAIDLLHASQYKNPDLLYKKRNGIFGFRSKFFCHQSLTDSAYEADSQTRLYGGLSHSHTLELDIKLSYPKLTGPVDLLTSFATDEGFVSSSASLATFDSDWEIYNPTETSRPPPYFDYKVPLHNLNLWKDCVTHEMLNHRTWERLGQPAGSTHRKLYLTEAGSKTFNEIQMQRLLLLFNLVNFYRKLSFLGTGWTKYSESELVKLSILAASGVASDAFQFNVLSQMFVPQNNTYFIGVDPISLHSVLLTFSRWGTCYRRLLNFCHSKVPSNHGAVFQAFKCGILRYLRYYLCQLLSIESDGLSLLALANAVRKIGDQIQYIAQLCKCSEPDLSGPTANIDFPTGVRLLSYLYEETVHQPDPCNYLVLLHLLQKSSVPYLQFIRNWMFRGHCWDIHGEFMLKVNASYGLREDRQNWLKYIELANPADPSSCVPLFLASLANEIYSCGRTILLMRSIFPAHFLIVDGADSPELEISFSTQKLQSSENKWTRHHIKMNDLEKQQSLNWLRVEAERRSVKHKAAAAARKAAQDGLVEIQGSWERYRQEHLSIRAKELNRLKQQAEEAAEARSLALKLEREEDRKREEERQHMEKKAEMDREKIVQEEKEKIFSYYRALNHHAEKRKRLAMWVKNRRVLDGKRHKFWQREMQGLHEYSGVFHSDIMHGYSGMTQSYSGTTSGTNLAGNDEGCSDMQIALQRIGSELAQDNSTSVSEVLPELPQPHIKLLRKPVGGHHVSLASNDIFSPGCPISLKQEDIEQVAKQTTSKGFRLTNNDSSKPKPFKKLVPGQDVSRSTVGEILVGYPENHTRKFKKPVPGQNVSASNVSGLMMCAPKSRVNRPAHQEDQRYSNEIENKIRSTRAVPGRNVSLSSMGDLFQTLPQHLASHTTLNSNVKRSIILQGDLSYSDELLNLKQSTHAVLGKNVSMSSVGDLLHPTGQFCSNNITQDSKVSLNPACSDQHYLRWHSDDVLSRCTSTVQGRNISLSSVGSLLQSTELQTANTVHHRKSFGCGTLNFSADESSKFDSVPNENRIKKFNYLNKSHGKHVSQSVMHDILYDGTKLLKDDIRNLPINSTSRHPSFSTVQLLLHHELPDDSGHDLDSVTETFQLQLPTMFEYTKDSKQVNNECREIDLLKTSEEEWEVPEEVHVQLLPALLRHCIIHPISQQISLVNRCMMNHFMVKLNLLQHFKMMRHFCFMEDGEFGQILCSSLFERVQMKKNAGDVFNPVVLDSLILRAVQGSSQRNSPDASHLTYSLENVPTVLSAHDPASLGCFALKYDISWPWNIVITDSNHKKYGQVFGFLLQLKRVMWVLDDIRTRLLLLNDKWKYLKASELRNLHLFRHEMQNFVKVMQGYVSTQVVHVCWHEFLEALKAARCLEDLHRCHVEYLHKCVFRCLLTHKTRMVMSVIADIFKTILHFWKQLFSNSVKFTDLKATYTNFCKFSGFLYKVVSKLVDHGYQPPLEDFLLRLNFNGFYGSG